MLLSGHELLLVFFAPQSVWYISERALRVLPQYSKCFASS